MRKVAIVGTNTRTRHLAPETDPSWEIWGFAEEAQTTFTRLDRWYEIHTVELRDGHPYAEWLKTYAGRLVMQRTDARFPASEAYPLAAILAEFGPHFMTCSMSYLMAHAIHELKDAPGSTIGIWGVECADDGEYGFQKESVLHFIDKARDRGIDVFIPEGSDLVKPKPLYGFDESGHVRSQILDAHLERLERAEARIEADMQEARDNLNRTKGAIEMLSFVRNNGL